VAAVVACRSHRMDLRRRAEIFADMRHSKWEMAIGRPVGSHYSAHSVVVRSYCPWYVFQICFIINLFYFCRKYLKK